MSTALRGLVGGLLFACLAAAPAGAAWTPPVGISEPGVTSTEPQIAIDAAGNTTAVWTAGLAGSRGIRSAFRPAGGQWADSVSRIGLTSTNDCHDPRLAVDAGGDAVVVAECEEPSAAIRGAYRPGGSWSGGLEVPGSAGGTGARVGIDSTGKAVAIWLESDSVQSAFHPPTEGWKADTQVSTVGKVALEPNLAVSPGGYAYAIWREERKNTPTDPVIPVQYSVRHGSAAWTAPSSLTVNNAEGPVTRGEPQISINPAGARIMSWVSVPSLSPERMQDRTSSADSGGNSEPARILSETDIHVEEPRIALGPSGLSLATFLDSTEGVFRIRTATATSMTGAWSSLQTVSTPSAVTGVSYPVIAAAPTGNATVSYWGIPATIYASSRLPGGSFASAVPISNAEYPGFGEPVVTTSEEGDSIVAWRSEGDPEIAVAVNDVTPPTIANIDVPAKSDAGSAVSMRADSTDSWSPAQISWDFGDGTSAAGSPVSHVYSAAGEKTIAITARDAAGNVATESRQISVTGPIACPPIGGGRCGGLLPGRRVLRIAVRVPKQTLAQIEASGKLKLRCRLTDAGRCGAAARFKPAGAVIGRGTAKAKAGRFATLKIKLSDRALKAIEDAKGRISISLAVTGTAPGYPLRATATKKLTIKRP